MSPLLGIAIAVYLAIGMITAVAVDMLGEDLDTIDNLLLVFLWPMYLLRLLEGGI